MSDNGQTATAKPGKTAFKGHQLKQIEDLVDDRIDRRIAEVLQPVVTEFADLIPFVRSLKEAADAKTKFWNWLRAQAEQVASTNIKYAINAALWFILLVIVLGVVGAWGKGWMWLSGFWK